MKKILLPLFIILLLTGCTVIDKNTNNYVDVVNTVLASDNNNVNTASIGYKYYIPVGVDLVYDGDLNKEFKIKDNKIVMYVDIISYYYKNSLNYVEKDKNIYYYSEFDNGYIAIFENEDDYFLKIIYNYAKVESYVKKDELVDIIVYSTIILKSITYNDNLIGNVIEKGVSFGNEITYEIGKPEDSESKFSQYLQEYVQDSVDDDSDQFPVELD